MERLQIKLLIDGGAKRVVFAEADKAFVDFLFRILSLPIAAALGLLGKGDEVGSLTNLHGSIENLNDYLQPKAKEALLKPAANFSPTAEKPVAKKLFYGCHNYVCNLVIAEEPRVTCPTCRLQMTRNVSLIEAGGGGGGGEGEGGSVKGLVTYMVMDDLTVSPMSITMLKKINLKTVAELEEKIVYLGKDEAVKLLSASLHSKNVLTEVFLGGSNITSGHCTAGVKRERTS